MSAPPFWLHCNVCARFFSREIRFFVGSCTHIVCKKCAIEKGDQGRSCPLCVKAMRFQDITKLEELQRKFFRPDLGKTVDIPSKMFQFQDKHKRHLHKITKETVRKHKKVIKAKAALREEIMKLQEDFKKHRDLRKKMQEKLAEIYIRQKQKEMMYRSRNSNGSSFLESTAPSNQRSSVSKGSVPSFHLDFSAQSRAGSCPGFFDPGAPFFNNGSSRSSVASGFSYKSSQSSRKPIFS